MFRRFPYPPKITRTDDGPFAKTKDPKPKHGKIENQHRKTHSPLPPARVR